VFYNSLGAPKGTLIKAIQGLGLLRALGGKGDVGGVLQSRKIKIFFGRFDGRERARDGE
jgi:hypothetical protein